MDLKLGFCVISLNLLILLVVNGTEARKLAEGNVQGKRLNFPVADEVVQKTNDTYFWIYEENGYHRAVKENAQVHPSSNNKNLENKDDTYFWIYQGHHKSKKENVDNYFWIYNNREENTKQLDKKRVTNKEKKNHQQAKTEDSYFRIYDKQGEKTHQQAKKENSHLRILEKRGENKHQQAKTEKAHIHSSSHMDHIDPSLRVFFLMDDLKQGEAITVSFPRRDLSSSPSFLPREEADSVPFSLKELPNLLRRFSFSKNSPQAKAIEDTLRECEVPPIKGETKYCASSFEAMLDFVQGIMGEKTQFKALSTTHLSNSTPLLQKYIILDAPLEVAAPKMVACHTMPYAYAVFYCHYTISKSKVFKVSLGGENGDKVEAIAVCHLDTSEWSPSHVSFQVLGILPGTSPICHFFPSDNLVWVPKIATVQAL
ncbi:BURP domain protein USPL1-like [Lycium barbarum]|uniref:BURP domain protein USPL1-like n=1 Tax=Lycium barbarum TaxID=112863 RepID=UPI00293E40E6|nr:BURP domain protein USPL1-like [Lycium barbarum]XP_060168386.1 BURP domain protein USPL1-like [Lycium barbarum]